MERYDNQSCNSLWKRAVPPADLPDRFGERAGHRLLPGVRDPFLCVSIPESRRAPESCPHACGSGIASSPGISAAVRTASPATISRAHRLILLETCLWRTGRPRPAPEPLDERDGSSLLPRTARLVPPTEPPSDDALHDQMIGGVSYIHARTKINLPVRRKIKVNHRKDLLRLFGNRIEV
jgi:hypothetical protein